MTHKKCNNPNCAVCRDGLDAVLQWQKDCYEKYGFYIHVVTTEADTATGFSAHTHGVLQNFNHDDLEIVLRMDDNRAASVLVSAVERIKEGLTFSWWNPMRRYPGVLKNYDVACILARESGRPIVRLILPDQHGHLWPSRMTERDYQLQWRV